MKVVVTAAALADLVEIGRAIAGDNPERAESFVAELYDRCRQLASSPRAFPLIPHWEDRGIRRRTHGNYLIFYRIEDDEVQVLHVLHGARDYTSILFPDE
ncbi:plasmid stabilization protein [Rhodoplanes elegans]|uniref:Plasmid stabilization protein n=1 Tax=Rhodoplanes elegans TaxID=29408 RepID=A0A327K1P5_9BRAD|nr:type II toxin-antitoxin system RelE/ParE family toxin [Rhodoplanes elegans]MBK5960626.1 plasmid stabilization protein [Rhodoplanes elegans]RAI31794.1 plasmid stabilization protein [Rhodoplanes elegans]